MKNDLKQLYKYREQLNALKYSPFLNFNQSDMSEDITVIFGLLMPFYFFIRVDFMIDEISKNSEMFYYHGFWFILSCLAVYYTINKLVNNIKGFKKYKKANLNHERIDVILEKYEQKITNKSNSYNALSQNKYKVNQMIKILETNCRINKINKPKQNRIKINQE